MDQFSFPFSPKMFYLFLADYNWSTFLVSRKIWVLKRGCFNLTLHAWGYWQNSSSKSWHEQIAFFCTLSYKMKIEIYSWNLLMISDQGKYGTNNVYIVRKMLMLFRVLISVNSKNVADLVLVSLILQLYGILILETSHKVKRSYFLHICLFSTPNDSLILQNILEISQGWLFFDQTFRERQVGSHNDRNIVAFHKGSHSLFSVAFFIDYSEI